jgi:hypothetical protein
MPAPSSIRMIAHSIEDKLLCDFISAACLILSSNQSRCWRRLSSTSAPVQQMLSGISETSWAASSFVLTLACPASCLNTLNRFACPSRGTSAAVMRHRFVNALNQLVKGEHGAGLLKIWRQMLAIARLCWRKRNLYLQN